MTVLTVKMTVSIAMVGKKTVEIRHWNVKFVKNSVTMKPKMRTHTVESVLRNCSVATTNTM